MRVPHLIETDNSSFYQIVRAALQTHGSLLKGMFSGYDLQKPGSDGIRIVDISEAPEFETDWTSSDGIDWSRFPARTRAAATALRDTKHYGRFSIMHQDGRLEISPLA
jgi:hypothetical protein